MTRTAESPVRYEHSSNRVSKNEVETQRSSWSPCPHCATPNSLGLKFCKGCGNSITVKATGQIASDANMKGYIKGKEKQIHNSVVAGR